MTSVVNLSYPKPEIALIAMEDQEHHNTMSKELEAGIAEAFAKIEGNDQVKVVITQGFGNYYLCGGTQENLEELHEGKKKFTDSDVFMRPLQCKLPTIAAVQGHAIGGGLTFACLHDFMFLSKGSTYAAPYMKYGFTPGVGSTYLIPKRFGDHCGKQMLFTARHYNSQQLVEMGSLIPFYPKKEVIPLAMQLAEDITDKTLTSVKLLKEQLSLRMRSILPSIFEKELTMHAQTLTSPEALKRIKESYQK